MGEWEMGDGTWDVVRITEPDSAVKRSNSWRFIDPDHGGAANQISRDGGREPRWRKDDASCSTSRLMAP